MASNTVDSVGKKPEMAKSNFIDMNGCVWSPYACEVASRMIEDSGALDVVGLPGSVPLHFENTQRLRAWSEDELNRAFVEGAD